MPEVTECANHIFNLAQDVLVLLLYLRNLCLETLASLIDVGVDGLERV